MTTSSLSTVIDNTTDAGFRTWGSEFSTQTGTVGMIQTADTGQINWTTVTRGAINTPAGYEIWKFSDSSLFLKIEYGSGNVVNTTPQMWVTVGTGSNGSGTITGQTNTRNTFAGNAMANTAVVYTSRWCHNGSAFSVSWKEAGTSTTFLHGGILCVGKSVDGTGAATTQGFGVLRGTTGGTGQITFQSVRIAATAQTFNDVGLPGFVPGLVTTTSLVAATGNVQAYDMWLNLPDVQPFAWANVSLTAEAARGNSYVVAQVGAVTHTYVSSGAPSGVAGLCSLGTGSNYGLGMIFE